MHAIKVNAIECELCGRPAGFTEILFRVNTKLGWGLWRCQPCMDRRGLRLWGRARRIFGQRKTLIPKDEK